jgi:hypothetical protein
LKYSRDEEDKMTDLETVVPREPWWARFIVLTVILEAFVIGGLLTYAITDDCCEEAQECCAEVQAQVDDLQDQIDVIFEGVDHLYDWVNGDLLDLLIEMGTDLGYESDPDWPPTGPGEFPPEE